VRARALAKNGGLIRRRMSTVRDGMAGLQFDILMVYLKRTLTGPTCFFCSVSGVIPASREATSKSANGLQRRIARWRVRGNIQRVEKQTIFGTVCAIFLSFAFEIGTRSSSAIVRRSKMKNAARMVRSAQAGRQIQDSMQRDEPDSREHVAHAAERFWALVMPQDSRSARRHVCSASDSPCHISKLHIVL